MLEEYIIRDAQQRNKGGVPPTQGIIDISAGYDILRLEIDGLEIKKRNKAPSRGAIQNEISFP